MSKKLIIFGSDKISNFYEKKIYKQKDIIIARDNSTNVRRVFKLLIKRSLSISTLIKMSFAELLRKKIKNKSKVIKVKNNKEILSICEKENVNKIILFRCGLIIKPNLFNSKIQIINVHCADLPSYAGLGTIDKALRNNHLEQNVCAHIVNKDIDTGKVLYKMKYFLDPKKTYMENEDFAYKTGYKLLIKHLI